MFSAIAAFALTGLFAQTPAVEPAWFGDYHLALKKGIEDKKPLAVFVGTGARKTGVGQVTDEGGLDAVASKLLAEKYVCVYLDSSSKPAKELVAAMAITKGKGLVISDRTGGYQAYHHDGALSQADLAKQLHHFANPNVEISTTVTNGRVSHYGGNGQTTRPATTTVRC